MMMALRSPLNLAEVVTRPPVETEPEVELVPPPRLVLALAAKTWLGIVKKRIKAKKKEICFLITFYFSQLRFFCQFIKIGLVKKIIFIILGILVLLAAGGGFYYFKFYQKSSSGLVNPLTNQKTESEAKLLVWEDPAGFKFSYPEGVKINNHPEDEENYAHLELTSTSHPGSILVWMKDTNYKNIQDWVKKEASASSAQVFDSDLGDHPAQKVALTNPQKMVMATLDGNALVLVEVYPEDSWWNQTYNQILSSFEFVPLKGEKTPSSSKVSGSSGQTSGGGIVDEGEEIVE